ncbi:hypothetical protein [Dawidia soli]|uniref:Uncharacterized protein n=1 Tax=Dawidia soli TaxID=2782352 RepID=A0AAP2D8Z4_9BACT|nr:hypothetical protein [Dawidia soli]MBT1687152.1 hypothetical protein [Dawidia soli]
MKVLKTIELDEEARFERYVLDIFLVALLPIGIWFLQPRVNRVVAD